MKILSVGAYYSVRTDVRTDMTQLKFVFTISRKRLKM